MVLGFPSTPRKLGVHMDIWTVDDCREAGVDAHAYSPNIQGEEIFGRIDGVTATPFGSLVLLLREGDTDAKYALCLMHDAAAFQFFKQLKEFIDGISKGDLCRFRIRRDDMGRIAIASGDMIEGHTTTDSGA